MDDYGNELPAFTRQQINERFGLNISVKPRVQSEIIEKDKPAFDDDTATDNESQGVE